MVTRQTQLSQDLIFDILSSPRRRYMLYYLRTHGGHAEVTELAKQVAAWEYETDPSQLDDQQQKRVYVSLYQTHIPKLDDVGIISYDKDAGVVELTDRAADVEGFLSPDADSDRRWQQYYLGLSLVSFIVLALAAFDVAPFDAIPDIVAGVTVGVAFAALAVVHYLTWRQARQEIPPELRDRG